MQPLCAATRHVGASTLQHVLQQHSGGPLTALLRGKLLNASVTSPPPRGAFTPPLLSPRHLSSANVSKTRPASSSCSSLSSLTELSHASSLSRLFTSPLPPPVSPLFGPTLRSKPATVCNLTRHTACHLARPLARHLARPYSLSRCQHRLEVSTSSTDVAASAHVDTRQRRQVSSSVHPTGALPVVEKEGEEASPAATRQPAAHARGRARVAPPDAAPPSDAQMSQLHDFIANSKRLVVLTGAGISTESGIPDYRGPQGAYSTGFKPMPHQEFVRSEASQQRYWARSYIGWRRFTSATPGPSHKALARLEARGRVGGGMITQNVDRLHHAVGSNPVELHGTTHRVVCLGCGHLSARHALQARIQLLNPEWAANVEYLSAGAPGSEASFGMRLRPDGDVEIGEEFWRDYRFVVPPCELCGGPLKPDVVFFGDNVPKERADEAHAMVANGDAMLAVGSSLMVLSAFRLARQMIDGGKPLALLNVGPTRADELASVKVEARCGEVLTRLISFGSLDVPVV